MDDYLNGKMESKSHPYKAYVAKRLNYDKNVKTIQMYCELYANDEAEKMDDNDPTNKAANSGLVEKFEYTMRVQTFAFRGCFHIDFLRQERLL